MTKREEEELEQAQLIAKTYLDKQDIYNDIYAKLELLKHIGVDNSTLEYSLSMYATDIQILLQSLKFIKE